MASTSGVEYTNPTPTGACSTGARERFPSTSTLSTSYLGYTTPVAPELPGLCCPPLMNPPRGMLPLLLPLWATLYSPPRAVLYRPGLHGQPSLSEPCYAASISGVEPAKSAPLRALRTGARERSLPTPTLSTSYPGYTTPVAPVPAARAMLSPAYEPHSGLLPPLPTGILEHK